MATILSVHDQATTNEQLMVKEMQRICLHCQATIEFEFELKQFENISDLLAKTIWVKVNTVRDLMIRTIRAWNRVWFENKRKTLI